MKLISGLVLVKETGFGIPNLVVAVFDSELKIEAVRGQAVTAELIGRIGKRISSVATNAEGQFSLSAGDLEFPGNEPRPDLMLMVLAPEDIQDPKLPYPRPTEERVLYLSTVPRADAGAEEAYVIRLLQAQLDRFQIAAGPRGRDVQNAVRELSDGILHSLDVRDGIRARLAERRAAEQEVTARARRVAQAKLKNFSALPPHLRGKQAQQDALLITDRSKIADELPRLQAKSISDALTRMRKAPSPTIRLHLTAGEIAELGLRVADNGKVEGKVPAAKLSAKLRSLVNVLDLVRVRNSAPSLEELERKYLTPIATPEPRAPAPEVEIP